MYLSRLFITSSIALIFSMPAYSSNVPTGKDEEQVRRDEIEDSRSTKKIKNIHESESNQKDITNPEFSIAVSRIFEEYTQRAESGQMQSIETGLQKADIATDPIKAIEWLQKTAEHGFDMSQEYLGLLYYNGHGVEKNLAKAAEWFQKSADQGFALAQHRLGMCYYRGHGVEKNLAKAAEWIQKSADQGLALAQYRLGMLYCWGHGVEKNLAKAAEWLQKSADQGLAIAQHALGMLYFNGHGVEKNLAKAAEWIQKSAAEWIQKSADQGLAMVQYNLGMFYFNGHGVEKNLAKAAEWIQKSADQGLAMAQYALGMLYYNGHGVEKNLAKAVEILFMAAKQKDSKSITELRKIFLLNPGAIKSSGVFKEKVEVLYQVIADITAHCEQKMVTNSNAHGMQEAPYALPRLKEFYTPIFEFGKRVSSILEPFLKAQPGLMVSCIKANEELTQTYGSKETPRSLLIRDGTITFGEKNVTAVLQYKYYLNLIPADFKRTRKHINKLIDSLYPPIASLHACQQAAYQNDPGAIERFQQEKTDYDEIMAINQHEIQILKDFHLKLDTVEEGMKQLLTATTGMRNREFLDSEEFNFFKP